MKVAIVFGGDQLARPRLVLDGGFDDGAVFLQNVTGYHVKTTDEFQEVSNDCEIVFEVLAVFASRESVELKGAMTKSAS